MASKRQIEANRANAKRSTGPRTVAGKARASRNARRHGLSRLDEDDIDRGGLADTMLVSLAYQSNPAVDQDLVQTRLRLSHIRDVRHGMLVALLDCPSPKQMKRLIGLERYERVARAEQRRALKRLRKG